MTTPTYRGAQPNIAQAEPVTIGGGILVLGNLIIGGLPLFTDAKAKVDNEFTHNDDVVEKIEDHQVIAGEGSELPTGTHIREAGSLDVDPDAEV